MDEVLQAGAHLVVEHAELVKLRALGLLDGGLRAAVVKFEAVLVVNLLPLEAAQLVA